MIIIDTILSAIANGEKLIDDIWTAYNSSAMVASKKAQMTQEELDQHNALIQKAMHGTAQERQDSIAKLRELTSE